MTRRLALALRHVGFEDLGSFEIPLKEAGYAIEYIDIAERDPATLDPLDADLFFILGGPISVYDHADYPFIAAEIELLRVRLGADLPTLGICLGAQMMAAALGARVYPAPEREIGWSALDLSETGGAIFSTHCATFPFFTGMATPSTCRQGRTGLRRRRFARTRPSRGGRMSSPSSFIRKSMASGSSAGLWGTRANWRRSASILRSCAAMPADIQASCGKPALTFWPAGCRS